MHKVFLIALAAILALTINPLPASAHGHTSFEIKGKIYSFTIGSLNEPIAVDDKTGLDLRVVSMAHHDASEGEHAGAPVEGLDKTLQLELIAGDKKKTLSISPAFGAPGSYRANFVPTVQTTYGYRLFGTIDNVPFDYTWQCNPAGHPAMPTDKTETKISEGVTRVEAAGSFGCPVAKADLGFPEASASIADLNNKVANSAPVSRANAGIVLGAVALLVGVGSLMKKRS